MRYGIRELKDGNLSRAVKQASQGEEVVVTDHGRPVAKIVPYPQRPVPSAITELLASGRLELRTPLLDRIAPIAMLPGRKLSSDYIKDQRR